MTAAGVALVVFALALFIPSLLARRRVAAVDRASLAFDRDTARAERDHYRHNYVRYLSLYLSAVRANAVLLERVGGDLHAAASEALAATIDREWFELSEGER